MMRRADFHVDFDDGPIIERVIEDISFDAPDHKGETIVIDASFVSERVGDVAADEDLSSYIL